MINKIYHIGDVHIRNFQRHSEYKKVFQRLFKYIDKTKTPSSIIYLAGDIVHQKTDMTPELISLTSYFLKECANRLPTILITGNHDTNLNNDNRLDALSPIVEALNHPNLFYWMKNGVYKLSPDDNITWSVFSLFNRPVEWITAADIKTKDIKIALHHGAVSGAKTDLEHDIVNETVSGKMFSGFDYVLLGDIHKRQYLNKKQTIAYPGSLIQQNFGEEISHGLLVWNLDDSTSEYVEIKNDIAYATLNFKNNKLTTSQEYIDSLPKYLRLRVKHENTDRYIIDDYLNKFKRGHVIKEYVTQRINNYGYNISNKNTKIGDVRDIEYQNELIEEYLKQTDVPLETVDGIRHINRVYNAEINANNRHIRNAIWKLKYFEFSNMFSYGPGNKIDFTTLNGLNGIFASNASGKSSILDALTFILYDKCSRTFKASDILNIKKKHFNGKVTFELNGEDYVIERNGDQNNQGRVKVDVNFYKLNIDGSKVDLRGDDRDGTNKIIREYIGTYEDFLMTALSVQNDNKNFVFKSQRERKELLYSFLDISVFSDLYNFIKDKIKEKNAVLNALKQTCDIKLETGLIESQRICDANIIKFETLEQKVIKKINDIQSEIDELEKSLIDIPEMRDRSIVEMEIESHNKTLREILLDTKSIAEIQKEKKAFLQNETNNVIIERPSNEIRKELTKLEKRKSNINANVKVLKKRIQDITTKEHNLEKHEYDPNCFYCVNNSIVKDAMEDIKNRPDVELQLSDNENEFNLVNIEITELTTILNKTIADENIIITRDKINLELETIENKIQLNRFKYQECASEIKILTEELESIETLKDQIKTNHEIRTKIAHLNELKADLLTESGKHHQQLLILRDEQTLLKYQLSELLSKKAQISEFESDIQLHEIYMDSISPVGIPYMLLMKVLPVLENEVNKLLTDLAQFNITLTTEDKDILCYINYNNGDVWPIELGSGMEKFVVSVALRAALVEVTSLPRPNFMAIDEGFGVLDATNILNAYELMNKIKSNFDFIICITHLDLFKDLIDSRLEIVKKHNDFSYINNHS